MDEPRWTLDELAERVDVALAVDYAGPPSARVRAVPDRRAIRWYTTIGLIDRPVAHRGRTALYGPRHLLQLVAVKRLQARGLPLVAIQQELAGATDTQLARVARLPGGPARPSAGASRPASARGRRHRRRGVAGQAGRGGRATLGAPRSRRPSRLGRSPVARGGPGSGGSRQPPSPRRRPARGPAPTSARRRSSDPRADRGAGIGRPRPVARPCGGCGSGRGDPAAGTGAAGGCGGRAGRPRRRPAAAGRAPGTGPRPGEARREHP